LLQRRNIQVDVAPGLPTVLCHESRLRQILTNLLRNAALHGCSTVGPRIEIGPAPPPALPASSAENDAAGWVWIAVTDNGSGIPEARRGDVFLAGYRVPGTGAEGSGVGLAIVRRIVDYYGGRVLVDSRVSRGCSILFSLPRAAEMPRDASPADETPIRRRRRRPPSSENSPAQPEYA
jgi:signal transduction histidine kinase